jgi:hypothetical protein
MQTIAPDNPVTGFTTGHPAATGAQWAGRVLGGLAVLLPTYLAASLWGGLMLRDARLCALLPWRVRDDRAGAAARRPS